MNRILNFALLIAGLNSCNSQPSISYANDLVKCLTKSEVSVLNSLSESFEAHITKTYNLKPTEAYRKYLEQLSNTSFPQDFFQYESFESDVDEFYNSGFYKNNWAKMSSFRKEPEIEIPLVNGETQQQEFPDPVVLNPTSDYVQCLNQQNKVSAINDYLEVVNAGLDVSPALIAGALKENFSDDDLNNNLTRLIIAVNFHYQISLFVTGKE